jgi:hypothetical protein
MTSTLCRSWFVGAFALAALLGACAPAEVRTVLDTREGIEVSIRPERQGPRPPPGAEFQDVKDFQIERSLNRVVIRYSKVVSFVRSDPVPLFTPEQVQFLSGVLTRELPKLPAGKRIGLFFLDQHRHDEVDVELYPQGEYLVYEFRALLRVPQDPVENRGVRPPEMGVLVPQRDQVHEAGRMTVLKDPISSTARPDFRLPEDSGKKKEESPL